MGETAQALKERIKELTCLYEVTSIIANANMDLVQDTMKSIAFSVQKAFQKPDNTNITIDCGEKISSNGTFSEENPKITADILVFNESSGQITAFSNIQESTHKPFLDEENLLLNNVAIKIGNFLERNEIQKNQLSLRRQTEHADRLGILGEITAGIAHELNTPLANILGYAELLQIELKGNKKALEDLDKIIQNSVISREVVKKLMFFACDMPQEFKEINIVPSLKNAINLLDATFRNGNVKHQINIEDKEMWLRADTVQFTQIVFNLLINAIYFSPKNGVVTIDAIQTKNNIILKISDEGKGISDDAINKIFQPFYTTKPVGDGSGLGLSVVHGIVKSHKGTITAENNPNKGAMFTVTFPKLKK